MGPKQKPRLPAWLTRNILTLGLVSLFTDVSTEMGYSIIPVFLKDVLKTSPVFIGLIEAIAESTASTLKAFSGYISDRLKKRKTLIFIGYTFSAVVKPLLAISTAWWHVLMIRFADRFGKGVRSAPRDALIAESTKPEYFGRSYGFHKTLDNLGAVLGPALAFLVLSLSNQNYRLVFGLAVIPALVAVLLIIFGVKDIIAESTRAFRFSFRELNPKFKLVLLILIIFTLGNSSDAFLILRARDIGIAGRFIPLLWLVFNISNFLSSYPAGVISDRIGRQKSIFIGFMIFCLTYAGLAFSPHPLTVWLLFIFYGLYYGFSAGNLKAFVADLNPPEIRGTAFGIYYTAVGVTLLPANLLMGFLWQKFGFRNALFVGASLSLISGIMLITMVRTEKIRLTRITGA
jgi:MFS family permease